MQSFGRVPRYSPATASRVFSGEAVVITPAENMVRMFNMPGSRIWELVDGTRTVAQIAEALVAEYEVRFEDAARAVDDFLDELAGKGLIEFVA